MLRIALVLCAAVALLMPASAQAGHFTSSGGTIVYTPENSGDSDQIAGFRVGDVYRFTRFGGVAIGPGAGCRASQDVETIECPVAGVTTIVLDLQGGDDIAAIAPSVTVSVIFNGGPGNDGLFGGGGLDIFRGNDGNDNVIARDGFAEQVDCGDGQDTAITDDTDTRSSCEEIEGDADGDGVRRPADCDDTRAAIHPGAADVPDNGIDEDCSGTDSVDADRDHDGTPRPQDCNDGDAAIRPGIAEVIGNDVDENCDGRSDPFPPVIGSVSTAWRGGGRVTRNVALRLKKFADSTKIELRCSGRRCPFKKVRRTFGSRRTVNLHRFFKDRALRPGTKIELRLTVARRVGRVLRWTMRSPGGSPDVRFLCLPPGGRPEGC